MKGTEPGTGRGRQNGTREGEGSCCDSLTMRKLCVPKRTHNKPIVNGTAGNKHTERHAGGGREENVSNGPGDEHVGARTHSSPNIQLCSNPVPSSLTRSESLGGEGAPRSAMRWRST